MYPYVALYIMAHLGKVAVDCETKIKRGLEEIRASSYLE